MLNAEPVCKFGDDLLDSARLSRKSVNDKRYLHEAERGYAAAQAYPDCLQGPGKVATLPTTKENPCVHD